MLIKNAVIFQEGDASVVDVLIESGKIMQIAPDIVKPDEEMIEAKGLYLLPGMIDLNVRLKDDILSKAHLERLKNKAKKSGVTSFALMPDFHPSVQSDTLMELLRHKADASMVLAIKGVQESDENRLNNISSLLSHGGAFIQEKSHINGNLLRRILQYAQMKEVPFFCFCDNPDLNDNGVMHEGEVSSSLGLAGISKVSEISEVAKVASMALYYESCVLFQSLSTAESLNIIARAKELYHDIYAEVSIFHLIFSDEACGDFNTLAKLYPPLRDESERKKLLLALKEGHIDVLTSLHAAKSRNSKDVAFNDATYGVDALEEYLPLCYSMLVREGVISMQRLITLLSLNPAKILGLSDCGAIKEGYVADLVLFDPQAFNRIEDKNSLLYGKEIWGEVRHTIKRGELL